MVKLGAGRPEVVRGDFGVANRGRLAQSLLERSSVSRGRAAMGIVVAAAAGAGDVRSLSFIDKRYRVYALVPRHIVPVLGERVREIRRDPGNEAANFALGLAIDLGLKNVPFFRIPLMSIQILQAGSWISDLADLVRRATRDDELDLAAQIIARLLVDNAIQFAEQKAAHGVAAAGRFAARRAKPPGTPSPRTTPVPPESSGTSASSGSSHHEPTTVEPQVSHHGAPPTAHEPGSEAFGQPDHPPTKSSAAEPGPHPVEPAEQPIQTTGKEAPAPSSEHTSPSAKANEHSSETSTSQSENEPSPATHPPARGLARYSDAALNTLRQDPELWESIRGALGRVRRPHVIEFVNRFHAAAGFDEVLSDYFLRGRNKREGANFLMRFATSELSEASAVSFEMNTMEGGGGKIRKVDIFADGIHYEMKSDRQIRPRFVHGEKGNLGQLTRDLAGNMDRLLAGETNLRWVFDAEKLARAGITPEQVIAQLSHDVANSAVFSGYPELNKVIGSLKKIVIFR